MWLLETELFFAIQLFGGVKYLMVTKTQQLNTGWCNKEAFQWLKIRTKLAGFSPPILFEASRPFFTVQIWNHIYVNLVDLANERTSGLKVTPFNTRYERITIYTMEPKMIYSFGRFWPINCWFTFTPSAAKLQGNLQRNPTISIKDLPLETWKALCLQRWNEMVAVVVVVRSCR